jgi:hypothetical protein
MGHLKDLSSEGLRCHVLSLRFLCPVEIMDSLVQRVAVKFLERRTGSISLDFERHDVEGEVAKAIPEVAKALVVAKKAESELGKFEHEAKAFHDQAVKGLHALKQALATIPHKEAGNLAGMVDKDITTISGQNWTSALTSESGFTSFIINTFQTIRKTLARSKNNPEVQALQAIVQQQLGPVHTGLLALSDRFEKEFENYGDLIHKYTEDVDISAMYVRGGMGSTMDPHELGDQRDYNHRQWEVGQWAKSPTLHAGDMHNRLGKLVQNLEVMHEHLVKMKKLVSHALYGKEAALVERVASNYVRTMQAKSGLVEIGGFLFGAHVHTTPAW